MKDINGIDFNDVTGTNFGATTQEFLDLKLPFKAGSVYAWSLNDFNINYNSWTPGAAITIKDGAAPDVVSFQATSSPYLTSLQTMTATGTVKDTTGAAVTFDKSTVSTSEYWEVKGSDNNLYWFAKVGDGSKSMLLTNQDFAKLGKSFSLVNVDRSAGFRTDDTTDFESHGDLGSEPATILASDLNVAFYPRIDDADSPLSPAHFGLKEDGSDTLWTNKNVANYAAFAADAIKIDPATGAVTIAADGKPYLAQFLTSDNDTYFSDGSGVYTDSKNDINQRGSATLPDGTVINNSIYQAEYGYEVKFTNSEGAATTAKFIRISFGDTGGKYVWFVSKDFEFGAKDYVITKNDGTPGFDNTNLTTPNELSFQYKALLICFVAGTNIETIDGFKSVEDIRAGDFVLTKDHGYRPVRWIGSSRLGKEELQANPKLLPVRIPANALSMNVPSQDLFVSPQHRVLLGSSIVKSMFDQPEVLVKAKDLVGIVPGVEFVEIAGDLEGDVEYFHILFDEHEVINSNGAMTESFYPGENALMALDEEARAEIRSLFPEMLNAEFKFSLAREVPAGRDLRKCLRKHAKAHSDYVQN